MAYVTAIPTTRVVSYTAIPQISRLEHTACGENRSTPNYIIAASDLLDFGACIGSSPFGTSPAELDDPYRPESTDQSLDADSRVSPGALIENSMSSTATNTSTQPCGIDGVTRGPDETISFPTDQSLVSSASVPTSGHQRSTMKMESGSPHSVKSLVLVLCTHFIRHMFLFSNQ